MKKIAPLLLIALIFAANSYSQTSKQFLKSGLKKTITFDYQGAITDYNNAIERDPNYDSAYFLRGITKFQSGDLQSALTDYNKAIEINANFFIAYFNRGILKSNLGDKEGAVSDYNKAIGIVF